VSPSIGCREIAARGLRAWTGSQCEESCWKERKTISSHSARNFGAGRFTFHPSPVRRVLIPKVGKPGVFRPLGIPTVKDRTVQAAMKQMMEPIFEAGFYPTSYGFRPGRSVRGALAHLKVLLHPHGVKRWNTEEKPPFQWAIEGDIKGCFDNIEHHPLMVRVRRRIGDGKLNRLVLAFHWLPIGHDLLTSTMAADWQPAIFATSVEAPRLSDVPIFIETLILDFL
jgi:reverse transcriptase-like protein